MPRFAGISALLLITLKINFPIARKNLSPASRDPTVAMPDGRAENLPRVRYRSPASPASRVNKSSHH